MFIYFYLKLIPVQTLVTAADLATHLGNPTLAAAYLGNSTSIKAAYNKLLWDVSAGMFRDNDTPNSIHPQDGNSLAILFNLTTSAVQNTAISRGLTQFWTPIGPLSPELNDTIIPFVGGFEVPIILVLYV
jgi:neutral trehalase